MTIDAMNNFITPRNFSPTPLLGIIFYLILLPIAYIMLLIIKAFSYLYTNETTKR